MNYKVIFIFFICAISLLVQSCSNDESYENQAVEYLTEKYPDIVVLEKKVVFGFKISQYVAEIHGYSKKYKVEININVNFTNNGLVDNLEDSVVDKITFDYYARFFSMNNLTVSYYNFTVINGKDLNYNTDDLSVVKINFFQISLANDIPPEKLRQYIISFIDYANKIGHPIYCQKNYSPTSTYYPIFRTNKYYSILKPKGDNNIYFTTEDEIEIGERS